MAVVPDDDDEDRGQRNSDDEKREPHRAQTPPTPPVQHEPSGSPLPSPRPMRQRAMAQLRPVSIPNIVCDIAGPDPLRKIALVSTMETYDDPENGYYLYYTHYCNYCHYLHLFAL